MEPMNPFVLVAKATLAQVAHASEPAMALNEFALHISHTPPSGPVNPEEQMHAESATDPDGLLEFGPQNVHAADPVSALYRPWSHAEQAPPTGPVYPALHTHSAAVAEPAGAVEWGVHCWHAPTCALAVFALNVFTGQKLQAPVPNEAL